MDNEKTPEQKPYTRYRSSRLGSKKPLKKSGEKAEARRGGQPSSGGAPPEPGQPLLSGSQVSPSQPGRLDPRIPRKRRGWGKRIGYALLILLLALLVFTGISYWRLDRAVKASNAKVPADVKPALTSAPGGVAAAPVNILFLGSDKRPGESSRADTILLMRVNGQSKTISQLSIPRDTLAEIPGYGEEKINSAYSWGGPALMVQTVQELTGLPIHHYVELDFSGFPSIVDSLGGVEIDVPKAIDSQYPKGLDWTQVHFDPGPQKMSGEEALVYVRVRYSDDDFQRMGRQQQFMEALQKKVNSPVNLARMPLMAPDIIDNMTTDMSTNELMRLGWIKFRTPAERSRKFVLIGTGQDIGGVSYVVLDDDASQAMIRDFTSG